MEDLLPFYISIGVSKEQFMDSAPVELEPYDRAFKLKMNRSNYMNHLQGIYIVEALKSTVCNIFRKSGQKPYEYPSEPIQIFPLTVEEIEEKKEEELKKAVDYLNNLTEQSKKFRNNVPD